MAAVNSVLNETNAIGGDVGATYEAMEAAALKWAPGTASGSKLATASAGKFAEVSYSMLSAGLNAEQGIMATQQALILAKATMGDASEAAGLLATVYNNMGDKSAEVGVEMTHLSDVLAKTQAYFQIANLGQLNEGLKYAIPVAQQFGMSISEVTSVVGQLTTAGLQGSMAGTALGSMMSKVHDAAKKLDFSIAYDASGGVKLIDTLKNIQAKYGPINTWNTDTKLAFQEAFGQEGVRAVTLLQTSLGSLSTAYGEIANASGAAADMAGKMSDTYEDKMARLANASEAMQAQIGTDINQIKGFFIDMKVGFLQNVAAPIMGSPVGPAISKMTALFGMAAKTALDMGSGALNTAAQLSVLTANIQNAGGIANSSHVHRFMRWALAWLLTPLRWAAPACRVQRVGQERGFMQTFQGLPIAAGFPPLARHRRFCPRWARGSPPPGPRRRACRAFGPSTRHRAIAALAASRAPVKNWTRVASSSASGR
jgi:TP901 family phage tail tape measure protein